MAIDEDKLGDLIRAVDPAPRRNADLSASDIALRENIIRGTHQRQAPRRTRWVRVAAAAVASVAVVAIVVGNVLNSPQRSFALTPPELQYGNAEPLRDVVSNAHDRLNRGGGPRQESRVHSLMWAWNIDIANTHVEVVPQEVTYEWSLTEGSVSTVVAGESYWDDGERPEGIADSPHEPGDLIGRIVTPAAEFTIPPVTAEVYGAARGDLAPALEELGAPPGASSGQLLAAISLLMGYWTLTDAQHATLVEMLVDAGGITVLGETTDRAGRPVVGLRVTDTTSPYRDTVLLSQDTGRIVGIENELDEPLDFIPAGVVGYTLWDVE